MEPPPPELQQAVAATTLESIQKEAQSSNHAVPEGWRRYPFQRGPRRVGRSPLRALVRGEGRRLLLLLWKAASLEVGQASKPELLQMAVVEQGKKKRA